MDDNSLLMIVLAFVFGYMASGMMKQMCGRRLVEGEVCKGSGQSGEDCKYWKSPTNCGNNWQFNWLSPHQQCGWSDGKCIPIHDCDSNGL